MCVGAEHREGRLLYIFEERFGTLQITHPENTMALSRV